MKRLLFVSVLTVALCSCGGEPEQPVDVSSTSPATPPAADPGDSQTGQPAATAPAETPPPESTIADARPPVEPDADPGPPEAEQPKPPADRTGPGDSRPPVAGNRPGRNRPGGKRGTGGGAAAPPEPAPLVAAFPNAGASVGLSSGDLIPEIVGQDLEGVDFKLSDYKGKVIMLDFWGDW